MALFAAHQLACQKGERLLFAGLDFQLASGKALLLTGANGSGKSSLLRLCAGLSRPSAGSLSWNDEPINTDADRHHRRLIYLGHADALKAGLTLRENLRFWADLAGLASRLAEARVAAALDEFDLLAMAELPTRFLSAGQKRRLTLARLLLNPTADIPLWLLDEPTTALDAAGQMRLINLIQRHLGAGGLALIASHDALDALPGQRLKIDDRLAEEGQFVSGPNDSGRVA